MGCHCNVCKSADPRDKRLRCAALLACDSTQILIDCGPDIRQQLLRLGVENLDALLITHEHNDHLIGLDELRPFIFKQRKPFSIFAEARVLEQIRQRFAYAFASNPYPGAPRFELIPINAGQTLEIGHMPGIQCLRVMHGTLPILGFRCADIAYLTDVKSIPEETAQELRDLEILVTSALHFEAHHSHMTLLEAWAFAKTIDADRTYLIHLSHQAGLHRELQKDLPQRIYLAYDNLRLEEKGA